MATNTEISKLFVTLFNRATDAKVSGTFAQQAYNTALIRSILDGTYNQTLSLDGFVNGLDNKAFVEQVYKNALGKSYEDDKAGIDYWVTLLDGNEEKKISKIGRDEFVQKFLAEIQRYTDAANSNSGRLVLKDIDGKETVYTLTEADRKALQVFDAKVKISDTAASSVGVPDDPFYLVFGSGLSEITRDNVGSLISQKDYAKDILSFVNTQFPKGNPGNTGDIKGTKATEKDDTFTAIVQAGSASTLTAETKLDGLAGNDTLQVTMTSDFAGFSDGKNLTNVENIKLIADTATNTLSFNAKGISGVNNYRIDSQNGINLKDLEGGNERLNISYKGLKKDVSIGFDGQNVIQDNLTLGLQKVGDVDKSVNIDVAVTDLKVNVLDKNYANIKNVKNMVVGGLGDLKTELSTSTRTFDASTLRGSVDVKLAGGDNQRFTSFKSGSGDDTFRVELEKLVDDPTIDLGIGNDTLIFDGALLENGFASKYWDLSSVENIVLNNKGSLVLDLGSSRPAEFGKGNNFDRSASLKKVVAENTGSDVTLRALGNKDIEVIYKGADASQTLNIDNEGKVALTLDTGVQGDGKSGTGLKSLGEVNFAKAASLDVDVGVNGFEGVFSATKATDMKVKVEGDFTVIRRSESVSDFKNLKTLTLETDFNTTTNLREAEFRNLETITLTGTGDVLFRDFKKDRATSLKIDAREHRGTLSADSFSVPYGSIELVVQGTLRVKDGISADKVKVDLSLSDAKDNILGRIALKSDTASADSKSTLEYSTGKAGTTYKADKDALTVNRTQYIEVHSKSADINLVGQNSNEFFHIKTEPLTESLVLKGDLGLGDNNVIIDLSGSGKGVKLDISSFDAHGDFENTAYGNISGGTVEIFASEGKDVITLANTNNSDTFIAHVGDIVREKAKEVGLLSVSSGLSTGQSFSLNGVTFFAKKTLTASDIASSLKDILEDGVLDNTDNFATVGTLDKDPESVADLKSLKLLRPSDWDVSSGSSATGSGAYLTFTNKLYKNFANLEKLLKFDVTPYSEVQSEAPEISGVVNGSTYTISTTERTLLLNDLASELGVAAAVNGSTSSQTWTVSTLASSATGTYTVSDGAGGLLTIKIKAASSVSGSGKVSVTPYLATKVIAAILNGNGGGKNLAKELQIPDSKSLSSASDAVTVSGSLNGVSYGTGETKFSFKNSVLQLSSTTTGTPDTPYMKDFIPNWNAVATTAGKIKLVQEKGFNPDSAKDVKLQLGAGNTIDTGVAYKTTTYTVEGLKSSATTATTSATIEITTAYDATLKSKDVAKLIAAVVEGEFLGYKNGNAWYDYNYLITGSATSETLKLAEENNPLRLNALKDIATIKLNGKTIFVNDYSGDIQLENREEDLTGRGWKLVADNDGKMHLEYDSNYTAWRKGSDGTVYSTKYPGYDMKLTFSETGENTLNDPGLLVIDTSNQKLGKLDITFKSLAAGQILKVDGITVISYKDISAEDVAKLVAGKAFGGVDELDGAVRIVDYSQFRLLTPNNGFDASSIVLSGNKITLTQAQPTNLPIDQFSISTPTRVSSVDLNMFGVSTQKEGSNGLVVRSDSYVDVDKSDAKFTEKLDEITNFRLGVDKLKVMDPTRFKDFADKAELKIVADGDLAVSSLLKNGDISVNVKSGIATFKKTAKEATAQDNLPADTAAAANDNNTQQPDQANATDNSEAKGITLLEKFKALADLDNKSTLAFEDGSDTYLFVGGGEAKTTVDDLVVKLTGVVDVTDVAQLIV